MIIRFFGAAQEVTGSCHYVEAAGKKFLIDCGLQQGSDEKEDQQLPISPAELDFILLTHAHIDHSGRLPLLVKNGFKGKIYATAATCELCGIMLRDSAHIQELEAEWQRRKGKRAGKNGYEPLYTVADADKTLPLFHPCEYNTKITYGNDIAFSFVDAGHLLGSASIEVWLTEAGNAKKIVFSGDIGNINQPIINDPIFIKEANYIVMESTYGDRDHEAAEDYVDELAQIIDKTLCAGGNVVIPSFAVGRTQELLYFIREIKAKKLVKCVPDFPVYVDSPLANEATRIYRDVMRGYLDSETVALLDKGINPLVFENLHTVLTSDESKLLNADPTPKVIISSSGMCEAGRIRHHLKHNLWRSDSAVVFVGYQANGTLGRIILDGAKTVKLFGEEIAVKAQIHKFNGLSAHADKSHLVKWLSAFEKKPEMVFMVHGEKKTSEQFASYITDTLHFSTLAPGYLSSYDLINGTVLDIGINLAKLKSEQAQVRHPVSPAFKRLLASAERLLHTVQKSEGRANKDLARLADQINTLLEHFEK